MSDYERFKNITEILRDKNKNNFTTDDFEYLSSVGLLSKSQIETINSREELFNLNLTNEIQASTSKLMTSIKSPYQIDKDLGLELCDGLSSVFPLNSRCVTFEIQGENSVGYLSVNQNGEMVEIFKNNGVIEEFTVSKPNTESMIYSRARNFEMQELDIEKVIVNKKPHELDDVFYMRTGYESLPYLIEVRMPDLVSQLTNKDEILNNIHFDGLNGVIKFYEGSITDENLLNATIVSKIYDNLLNDKNFSQNERAAITDQMSHIDFMGDIQPIAEFNTISTANLCKVSCYGIDRLKTDNERVAVFKLDDGTAIVSVDGGIKQYKPDELLDGYDGIYNTPELFTMLDMYYMGETTIELQQKFEPEPEPEVKKAKTLKPGR